MGKAVIIIGPMFSGKSSLLGAQIERYAYANRACIIVKFSADTRYETSGIKSHSGREYTEVKAKFASSLAEIADELREFDVIGIDEVQFFPDAVEQITALTLAGKTVIAAGLDANFRGKPFGPMSELIAIADKVKKLSAVCATCGQNACFTKRNVPNSDEFLIGGAESYSAACRACFHATPN